MPQQPYTTSREQGFTVIELMIVVTLLGITMSVALPNLVQFLGDHRVLSTANELQSLLQFARVKAVNERTSVFVCLDTASWSVIEKNDCTNTGEVFRTIEINPQIIIDGEGKPQKIEYYYNGAISIEPQENSSIRILNIYGCHTSTKYYIIEIHNTGMSKVVIKSEQKTCSESESS